MDVTASSHERRRTGAGVVVLRYRDLEHSVTAVRLVADLFKREPPRAFSRDARGWELRFTVPEANRIEYLLELERRDGSRELVVNPGAPVAHGPFGPKSVHELNGYRAPQWLREQSPAGRLEPLALASTGLRATVSGLLWSPADAEPAEPLPLLVVHDGPEYAEYAALARFLDVSTKAARIPRLRAALLAPVKRDEHYSASARYSLALRRDLLPRLDELAPTPSGSGRAGRAGMGASLGALALLHAHRRHPDSFGGLFLQSGSFFRRRLDGVEARFPRFERIARFVAGVERAGVPGDRIPIALTCGGAEENLGSNRAIAAVLAAQRYPVTLGETRDAHNWVSWRDAFDPHLTEFLARAFG